MAESLNWLDVVLLVLILFSTVQGIGLGFVNQLFKVLQIVIAYFVSVSYFTLLGDFLNEILNLGIILDNLFGFESALIQNIGNILVNIVAFLILFFLIKTLINILGEIIGIGTMLPLVGSANKILGGIFGAIKGVFMVIIIMAIIYVLPWEFFQESLWNSQIFVIWIEIWPRMLIMLENALELNLSEIIEIDE